VQAQTGGGSTPFDYNPRFYAAYPELSTAYAAALANESAGRYSEALATYAGFLVSPHTDVAQDAAWRAARCLRSLGRLDDALTTVQSGLRRSSSNTPYRTNLYNLQGELYSAQGRSGDAQKAWAEAARLNAGR
jgi:tetratricopeptide (TPR) repeat protein